MDEIHVNSNVAYTGGIILGYSLESGKPIKTVFAIMSSSLYRKWSQVIRLIHYILDSDNAGGIDFWAKLPLYPIYHYIQ